MNDKEKIDRTLEIIKSTQDSLENQRLEFSKENKWETKLIGQNDAVDSLANTYFKAQKALLKKYHRIKGSCPNCYREFLILTNWHDKIKDAKCPYCLDEFDD